ncbi:MAG TPA: hypothetical protein VKT75_07090 [Acidobacteriaceae bacterium]|nr:hypothetical protein [Acidobacteriaceae bacterium]
MRGLSFGRRWLPLLLGLGCLNAQTCLVLSSPVVNADGTASLDLSVYTSKPAETPSALQWTFSYPSSIRGLTVDDGPALLAVGKTAICSQTPGAYNCLAVGSNAHPIGNGVIARVIATLAEGAAAPGLQITNPVAASPEGFWIRVLIRTLPAARSDLATFCRPFPRRGVTRGR